MQFRTAATATAVAAAAFSILLTASPAFASYDIRYSPFYGTNNTAAGVGHDPGTTGQVRYLMQARRPGFRNYTITSEQCDGRGQGCGYTDQKFSQFESDLDGFYRAPSAGHTYRTRGSWNDATTGVRYTNAVSPLIT